MRVARIPGCPVVSRPQRAYGAGVSGAVVAMIAIGVMGAMGGANTALAQQKKQPQPAAKQAGPTTHELGVFGKWTAARATMEGDKVCYVLGKPDSRKPEKLKRSDAQVFISSRTSDGSKNEFAVRLGFPGKPGMDGKLKIGATTFALRTAGENAFLKNAAQEPQVIEAMKKAPDMTIQVTSPANNETTDRYLLAGFGKALERIAKECP